MTLSNSGTNSSTKLWQPPLAPLPVPPSLLLLLQLLRSLLLSLSLSLPETADEREEVSTEAET
jgi:hypothetical protein